MAISAPVLALAQRPRLVPHDRVRGRNAPLDPADMQRGAGKVDLIPAEVQQFRYPQAMPPRDKDHGAVAVSPAVALRCPDQAVHFRLSQMLPAAQVGIGFVFQWLA